VTNINKIAGKKILVTGGAGFIGSNLCEKLLEFKVEVICLDNYSTGKKQNVEHLLKYKNFRLLEGDIVNYKTCLDVTKDIDYVLHQAALGSVPRSIKDPISTNEVNIGGFVNMLKSSIENKVKRFVYAASSSTYGDSKTLPKIEENIGKPLSPYAITKYVNELYADIFSKTYDIEVIGLRYFNVYGKRQDVNGPYAAVIPKFIYQLMNHNSPTINGDGTFSRDFTHINNVVNMNLLAITSKNKASINQVYNTAVGERTSILNLFHILRENLKIYDPYISKVEPIFGALRPGDVSHSLASIDKAKNLLNYNPLVKTSEGLKLTVDWFYQSFSS
jgi:UDP-N-acetylglucosamine 4-epimerase